MLRPADSRARPLRAVAAAALAAATLLAASAAARSPPPGTGAQWLSIAVPPAEQLADHRRIHSALASLKPQRKGVVDAYVVVVALDDDPVFGREAREAARVLKRRFDAAGRTIVLAGDEGDNKADAAGSPHHLALALARAAELMDRSEDVIVLYSTSHGMPQQGLIYQHSERGVGRITPEGLAGMLEPLGFRNRLLILQACYSGQFVPALQAPGTVVVTAASAQRPSFGCVPGNDWTLFGDMLINNALREPAPLGDQLRRAAELIQATEQRLGLPASEPQLSIGAGADKWMGALDRRAPKVATKPVGRPAAETSIAAGTAN